MQRERNVGPNNTATAGGATTGNNAGGFGETDNRGEQNARQTRDLRWAGLGGRIAPGVPTRRVGASLKAFADAAANVFKGDSGAFGYRTVLMDVADKPYLNVSSLVIVGQATEAPEAGVGFHILLLEGSIDEIAPIQRNEQGESFLIRRVVGDAYNIALVTAIKEEISSRYGVPVNKIYDGRASVVPADVKAEDDQRLEELIVKAMQAAAMAIVVKLPDFKDLNLASLDRNQQIISVVSLSAERPATNAEGYPIRSDFRLSLSAVDKSLSQEDTFAFSSEANVATQTGYVDLIFNPTTEGSKEYLYQPVFVINSLEATSLQTTGMALLAVSNTSAVATDGVWTRQFNPRTQHHRPGGLNDIGALGYDLGDHKKIDTRFEDFTQQDFMALMRAVVVPDLAFCLDTPETDSSSFWTAPFGFAAAGDVDAIQHLLDAANELTNGAFAKIYNDKGGRGTNGGVMIDLGIRVVQGYYTDSDGTRRDIADYDNLAIMNLFGDKDPNLIKEYSDTFLATTGSQDYRMAKRIRILERLQAFRLTGFATRNMFEPAFIEALTAACGMAGFKPSLRLPQTDPGLQQRATGDRFAAGRTSGFGFGYSGRGNTSGAYERTRSGFSRFI
jgi:hypothetical protein